MKKFVAMMIAVLMICTMAVGFASCNSNKGQYKVGVQSGTTGWSYMSVPEAKSSFYINNKKE